MTGSDKYIPQTFDWLQVHELQDYGKIHTYSWERLQSNKRVRVEIEFRRERDMILRNHRFERGLKREQDNLYIDFHG